MVRFVQKIVKNRKLTFSSNFKLNKVFNTKIALITPLLALAILFPIFQSAQNQSKALLPTPNINSLSINNGPTEGGTTVNITGANFFYERGIEIIETSAGGGYALALDTNGDIWAWGNNSSGQLSFTGGNTSIPTKIISNVDFSQISAGESHSLALDTNGDIWAWGSNYYGELGNTNNNGSSNANSTPAKITVSASFDQISAGQSHSLAIDSAGNIWAWGWNASGQLGFTANNNANPTPTKVTTSGLFSQISAGFVHSMALDTSRNIWSWGSNAYGPHSSNTSTPTKVTTSGLFSQISAGDDHSLALDTNGDVWACGNNSDGQLGYAGGSVTTLTKITVSVSFSQVAAEEYYSVALDTNGDIWAWGNNYSGQLGNTTNIGEWIANPTPTKVNTSVSFTQISTGTYHVSALDTNGEIWTWGSNSSGQLGFTANNTANPTPIKVGIETINASVIANIGFGGKEAEFTVNSDASITVTTPPHSYGTVDVTITTIDNQTVTLAGAFTYNLPTPTITNINPNNGPTAGGTEVEITGTNFFYEQGIEIVQISSGRYHSLALDSKGSIWAWGFNQYGQLGNTTNNNTANANPTPTKIESNVSFSDISAGSRHSLALDVDGNIWAWGHNLYGQLGNTTNIGTDTPNPTPTKINSNVTFLQIAVSYNHAVAIDTNGDIWSWGNNMYGQLGYSTNSGTTNPNSTLTKINSGVSFVIVSAGGSYSMAIDINGDIWSWGLNQRGQLGYSTNSGTVNPNPTPAKISSSVKFDQIAAGNNHALAIDTNGDIWAWGLNQYGQLGSTINNGVYTANPTPTKITANVKFNKVSNGGYYFSSAIDTDGNIWTWGYNEYGQLGNATNNNTTNPNPTPTKVNSNVSYSQISLGEYHALGFDENGDIWAWGSNQYGQLGTTTNSGADTANPTPTEIYFAPETIQVVDSIKFDNTETTTLEVISNTLIKTTTPPHPEDVVDVALTTIDGQEVTLTNGYTYQDPTFINLTLDQSELNIDLTPNITSSDGVVSSTKHTVSFTSNRPKIDLLLNTEEEHSNLTNLNNNTITVPITNNILTSPNTLSSNTWGFALDNRTLEQNNPNSITTWAKIPNNNESPINIKSTTLTEPADSITPTDTDIYYGAKINLDQLAGYYKTTVVYTAVEGI